MCALAYSEEAFHDVAEKPLDCCFENEYSQIIPDKERPCMRALLKELRDQPPLDGVKILLNGHLTLSTLVLLDLLLAAKAEVIVSSAGDLVRHPHILKKLKKNNCYIPFEDLVSQNFVDYFDVILDCGGYLANTLKPKVAFIELTHVDLEHYQKTDCPIISVDHSFVKYIETIFGTGDGFVRAINKIYIQRNEDHRKKQYLIFGYGKVGRGISYCLVQSGVPKSQIVVVEIAQAGLAEAQEFGCKTYDLLKETESIKAALKKTDCVVTATGVSHAISPYFSSDDFQAVEYLANMGTYDEWGDNFSDDRILNRKKPLNFMLEFPTRVLHLDPIFALMVMSCIDAIKNPPEKTCTMLQPKDMLQKEVLAKWFKDNEHVSSLEHMKLAIGGTDWTVL